MSVELFHKFQSLLNLSTHLLVALSFKCRHGEVLSIVVCQCLTWYLLVQSWVILNRQTGHIMKQWWYVPPIKIQVKNNHKFTIKISEHLHTQDSQLLTVDVLRQQLLNCSQYFSYLSHDIRCGCLKPSLKCWNLTTVFKWQGLECTDVVTWFFKKCLNHRLTPS